MQDNDFWIGQEQIPVDLSLLLTYSNDEDYWYVPGEYALRVYTVDTLNTNFSRPCFAFGERKFDPEMEDVSGAIENTLHELLDSGATPEDVYRIMGLVKESELSPETKEADSYLPIDLGYCIDGNIVSYEAVPEGVATVPENVDYPRYAEAMESHVPLPIATQIAKHDFSHRQADILMEAARNPHVSPETLETIADKTLSSGKMRGLLDIASVGKNPLDFRNMDEQTLKAAVSVLFHGGKKLPVTELPPPKPCVQPRSLHPPSRKRLPHLSHPKPATRRPQPPRSMTNRRRKMLRHARNGRIRPCSGTAS